MVKFSVYLYRLVFVMYGLLQIPSKQKIYDPHGPQMGIYMGPIWATHKGLMRDLQHGSMLDPHGQSHMGTIWVQYGKINPHLSSRKKNKNKKTKKKKKKKKRIDIFIQIWWTGKVPTERDFRTCASYCTCVESRGLKDIGVLFNSWTWWPHAYLYIPQF